MPRNCARPATPIRLRLPQNTCTFRRTLMRAYPRGGVFSRKRVGHLRSHAGGGGKFRLALANGQVYRLDAAYLERMGDQLRFRAPGADGATAAALLAELDASTHCLVRARANQQPAAPEINAAPPRNSGFAATVAADFGAAGVALRFARQTDTPVAPVLATARAGIAASESATGLAPVCRTPALAGTPWFRATPRRDAAGIRLERANAKARARGARVHQHLCQRALRRRALRHASSPQSSGANSRRPASTLTSTASRSTNPGIECGDSGGACENPACDFCLLRIFLDNFCPKCE